VVSGRVLEGMDGEAGEKGSIEKKSGFEIGFGNTGINKEGDMPIGTRVRVLTGEARDRVGVVADNALRNGVSVAVLIRFGRGETVIVATSDVVKQGE